MKNEDGRTVIFAVNRSLDEEADLECNLSQVAGDAFLAVHTTLTSDSPYDHNSMNEPNKVAPHLCEAPKNEKGTLLCKLPPFSWNMITVQ